MIRNDIITVERPEGCLRTEKKVDFTIWIPDNWGYVEKITLLVCKHGKMEQTGYSVPFVAKEDGVSKFKTQVSFSELGIHYYYFEVLLDGQKRFLKYNWERNEPVMDIGDLWKVIIYDKDFETPEWAKGKIIYHVFLDRFYRSDNYVAPAMPCRTQLWWGDMPVWKPNADGVIKNEEFFMGNIAGVTEKLEYLNELGVEIIYISPIYRSQSSHRYDASDYMQIDPYLGNEDSIKQLTSEAHKYGIKVILDEVFNHVGDDSIYFNRYGHYDSIGAYQSVDSPYYNWFKIENGVFQGWWGMSNLMEWNTFNQERRDYIYGKDGVIDYHFSLGIDGIRVDVADELSDDEIELMRKAVHRNKKDGYIVGEVWEHAIEKETWYGKREYLLGRGLDSVMNYPFSNAILKYVRFGDVECFTGTIEGIMSEYPPCAIQTLMTSLSTHDITRAMTTLAGDGINNFAYKWVWDCECDDRTWQYCHDSLGDKYILAKWRFKIATIIQYFLPGNPCVYYGDEAGLHGYRDPFNRKCYPWGNEDQELLGFFKELGQVRKSLKDLYKFDFKILQISSSHLIFERTGKNEVILVAINRTDNCIQIDIPEFYKAGSKKIFSINGEMDYLDSYGAIVLEHSYKNM